MEGVCIKPSFTNVCIFTRILLCI